MLRRMLKAKIHRIRVTQADLHYVGSVSLDPDLMEAADIVPYEQVHILDVDNGNRLKTYAIAGERGTGECRINGAAAHLVHPGDIVLILSYVDVEEEEARNFRPTVILMNEEDNSIASISSSVEEPVLSF